jgi:DDE superfamily endonuclease
MRRSTKPRSHKRISQPAMVKLQNDLDSRLCRFAQLQFALSIFLAMKCCEVLGFNDPNHLLFFVPSHFFWADAVKLFLHWLLYYKDQGSYSVFNIASTPLARIIEWIKQLRRIKFLPEWLKPRSIEIRQEASRKNLPPNYNLVTLIVDGRHSLVELCEKTAKSAYLSEPYNAGPLTERAYYSFKLGKPCLNTQMAIATDGYIEWVSDNSLPAGKWNDISQLKKNLDSLKKILSDEDIICFDGGYQSIDNEIQACIPHRKPKGGVLTARQVQENSEIGGFRGNIERKFALLAVKFQFLEVIYRHGELQFNEDFKTACALLNCEFLWDEKVAGLEKDEISKIENHPFFSWPSEFSMDEADQEENNHVGDQETEEQVEVLHGTRFSSQHRK